ncbi:hypothetical protein [Pedobacter chinensis]|uniref:hypothetical protein n=1 Tax=Pedobacter chinensis TaxID=2282421 RepID=UPI0013143D40|nr:hypothetical protein [Pedobacter chinensis]
MLVRFKIILLPMVELKKYESSLPYPIQNLYNIEDADHEVATRGTAAENIFW